MSRYDKRNVTKRLSRDIRHNKRAEEERSETLSRFPFIKDLEVWFFGGDTDTPHNEFVVHFSLNNSILVKHFKEVLKNKLRGALVERKKETV